MDPLCADPTPDHARLWAAARQLVDRLGPAVDRACVVDDALDLLVELFGADRGLVILGETPDGVAAHARGRGRALTAVEQTEISRVLLGRVFSDRACLLSSPLEEAEASRSMVELGIVHALAGPLLAGEAGGATPAVLGALYLDFRGFRRRLGPRHLAFFELATTLVGLTLQQERRVDRLELAQRSAPAPGAVGLEALLGTPAMAAARREVAAAVAGGMPILIQGESGTGKTLLAHAIAEASGRQPVVRATLGSSDDLNTIVSELFGHERGAFSGAVDHRKGLVAFADGGTLILDELLNLPPVAQQLLLDFTQFGTFRPLGHRQAEPRRAQVRIIAATQGDLEAAMADGRFRADLYYRLAGVTVQLPPLRARRAEIPMLAEGILASEGFAASLAVRRALAAEGPAWPGNVRELEAVLRRACGRARFERPGATTLEPGDFTARDLSVPEAPAAPSALGWADLEAERARLLIRERALLTDALAAHEGVVAHAARALRIPRTTLVSRLKALGLR